MKYYLILFGLLILISCNQKSHDKIIITEEAEKLFEKGVRTQIISFDGIQLIDSAKSIYIIPVGQRYLDKEENIESQGGLGLISSGRYDDRFYGENNYVLFYKNTKKTINIFNKRYILRLLDIKKVKEDIKLIFNGTNNDSNKNGEYDSEDITTLFVYSLNENELTEIFIPYQHYISHILTPDSLDLILNYGIDRDSSGTFEYKDEPKHYLEFNLETGNTYEIINDSIKNNIQTILDGQK